MQRIYLDYNATAPPSASVLEFLNSGESAHLRNPSSVHTSGKRARFLLDEVREDLLSCFKLENYQCLFHSGATEGMNSLILGFALENRTENPRVVHLSTDHSCTFNSAKALAESGLMERIVVRVDKQGQPDRGELEKALDHSGKVLLVLTYVNNETGVVLPLDSILALKEKYTFSCLLDNVQTIGKIENYRKLSTQVDAFLYSGHKFGALRGIGFTLVKEKAPFAPWPRGGGQEYGMRSGTQNTWGALSLPLALSDIENNFNPRRMTRHRDQFISALKQIKQLEVLAEESQRALNTINFRIPGQRADKLLTALDIAGIEVSNGSACSSGSLLPNRVLTSMGYSEEESKEGLRISFGQGLEEPDILIYIDKILKILKRFPA